MNSKLAKKIRKYAKLRGAKDKRLNIKTLRIAYDNADAETQKKYRDEMDRYFKAVESGKIEAGDSLIMAFRRPAPAGNADEATKPNKA